ncbi:MAG TPA: gamma-glutamyltransferase family protein [Burkholderiaceae bacterium]|nr:gamma-glutamyltransferase family protein [Burkholderiaceae bacterium]
MPEFDSQFYPYASRRNVVHARRGMVAASQPLAAQAGLRILQSGGNAIDAAIASAAALTVLEPTGNGIGGDAFALVWSQGKLHGLNSSGTAPRAISLDALRATGMTRMPLYGALPVNVPGAPAAWAALATRFGRLPLASSLAPAIEYARDGYAVTATIALAWKAACELFRSELRGDHFAAWFDTFCPDGRAPRAGEIWRAPDHAATLESIADDRAEGFYRGALAERIAGFVKSAGGLLDAPDLAGFRPEWVDPIGIDYRGHQVWEIPPNGQGIVALMALKILEGFAFEHRDTVRTHHLQFEAMKLAFADGMAHVADRSKMRVRVEDLLSSAYADARRRLIGEHASVPAPGTPPAGGTVYLCTADADGNMVSFIQSNYLGFGSGLVVPGTGIALQNRGHNFSLDPEHPNCVEPGKRPYHTIIPGFLTKGGEPVGPFGVMGAFMQPQGHVQVVMNTLDFGLNPQAALDAPRWEWTAGKAFLVEHTTPEHLVRGLAARGHEINRSSNPLAFGRGQIIWRDGDVLVGGTEPRTDGAVAAW